MRHLFDIPLGAQVAPIGSFKHLWLLDDLIGAVGNMASTMYAADASEMNTIRTNNANREINESQLAWARQQYEDEKAENRFLVDQAYERELENREYNTPAALRQRLVDAGFNPSMVLGNVGSTTGHVSVPTGSAPHANQPNMIPMQSPPPVVPPDIGQYFSRMADHMFRAQEEERADYALASDIQASNMNAYANLIKAFSEAKKNGVDVEFMKDSMKRGWQSLFLEQDKLAAENEWRSVTNNIQERQLKETQYANETQRLAVQSGIQLDAQNAKYLNALISSVKIHDNLSSAETAQRVISMINNDAAVFERLGLDKDMTTSQKFKNYVSSVTEMIGAGLAAYTGARIGMKKAVPMRPNNYLDDFYKPW